MQLIVSKLSEDFRGLSLALKDDDRIETVALINGNKSDHKGPVILLGLDQEVVYGMSHRRVVSRIYANGPQPLVTTKEMGHRLFEHGMRAAVGRINIGNTEFITCLDTFYKPTMKYGRLEIKSQGGKLGCLYQLEGYHPILITTAGFPKGEYDEHRLDIDKIQTEVSKKLKYL